jgi:hypothetical protein
MRAARLISVLFGAAAMLLDGGSLIAANAAPASMPAVEGMVGGANSPAPSPPPKLAIQIAELSAGTFAVKIPSGSYAAPPEGAPDYSTPGPIVAFKGPDGVWRGHGYLETHPRLLTFEGKVGKSSATLSYVFEKDRTYQVTLTAKDGAILMDETCSLGPRNVFVLDCYYEWLPSCGFAVGDGGAKHAFLYLPCFYDKPEVTIRPAMETAPKGKPNEGAGAETGQEKPSQGSGTLVTKEGIAATAARAVGVAVLSADPNAKDVAGFWCRDAAAWKGADTMGIQLWQRRQLPGDPASRHFLGPETKSDSTPNPRTAALLGRSLYEGHVTVELNLGVGTRKLGFAVAPKGGKKDELAEPFKKLVQANK